MQGDAGGRSPSIAGRLGARTSAARRPVVPGAGELNSSIDTNKFYTSASGLFDTKMAQTHTADGSGEGMFCSADGAIVRVRPRATEADVQALEYTVAGDGEEPVDVRVRQPLPEAVGLDRIGFPGPFAEDWDHDGSALVFETTVEPGESVTSGWAFEEGVEPNLEPPNLEAMPVDEDESPAFDVEEQTAGPFEPAATRDAAALETADDADDADDGASAESTGAAADAAADDGRSSDPADGDTDPSLELEFPGGSTGTTEDGDMGGFERATLEDDNGGSHAGALTAGDPSETGAGGSTDAPDVGAGTQDAAGSTLEDIPDLESPGAGEPVVARLAAELQSGELDEDHRRALRDALDARLSDSTNAFVEHLSTKLKRQTERLEEDVRAMEDSVEGLYGVKADANDLEDLRQAITDLDDATAGAAEVRDLESEIQDADEKLAALRDAHESLTEAAAPTEELEALRDDHEALDESLHEALESLESEHRDLEERAASEQRLEAVADDLEELRETAATAEALGEFRADHREFEAETDQRLADVRDHVRSRHNEAVSEIAQVRERLETEYSTDDELKSDLDTRVHRSVGTLALFGAGAAGMGASIPLALAGSGAAAITFLGGLGSIVGWRYVLEAEDGAIREHVDALREAIAERR